MTEAEAAAKETLSAFFDRVWSDETFAARLKTDTRSAIEEYFGPVGDDVELEIVRDTPNKKYIHIPASPQEGEVGDRDLMTAQGGTTQACLSFDSPSIGLSCTTIPTVTVTFIPEQ